MVYIRLGWKTKLHSIGLKQLGKGPRSPLKITSDSANGSDLRTIELSTVCTGQPQTEF